MLSMPSYARGSSAVFARLCWEVLFLSVIDGLDDWTSPVAPSELGGASPIGLELDYCLSS